MRLTLLSRLEAFVFQGKEIGFKYLWEVVMDAWGGVGMELRSGLWVRTAGPGCRQGRKSSLRNQKRPWDLFVSKPPPTFFLIEKIMHAHSKKKKTFFQKTQKGIQWKINLLSSPRPPVPSIFLQRHPTVNSSFCVFPENFYHIQAYLSF